VKLYVCWGTFRTFGSGHPCRNALDALQLAGHQPEIVRSHGWGLLPEAINRSEGRRLARQFTGKSWLPLLVTQSGDAVCGSDHIKTWAAQHPASEDRAALNPGRST
jgi:hypothetical protein